MREGWSPVRQLPERSGNKIADRFPCRPAWRVAAEWGKGGRPWGRAQGRAANIISDHLLCRPALRVAADWGKGGRTWGRANESAGNRITALCIIALPFLAAQSRRNSPAWRAAEVCTRRDGLAGGGPEVRNRWTGRAKPRAQQPIRRKVDSPWKPHTRIWSSDCLP